MFKSREYQVMARTKRPQRFEDVIGQDKIKTTLKNAYQMNRLGHAYLFCGSHGIGKTTLARIFAKVLNCDAPDNGEPCDKCPSCAAIKGGHSLEVIEIDGASNRGIDDIRQINESVAFAAKAGKCKVYILDEVHMLTKEAFNALLKTLESPPPSVKFLFATTEPHKVPETVLSRCQCFYLEPLTASQMAPHIVACAKEQQFIFHEKAAQIIAEHAKGSLRDALVLADQLISFCNGNVDVEKVSHFLGLLPKSEFFEFDQEAQKGNVSAAFILAQKLFDSGKNLSNFLNSLCEHFRQLLYIKIFKGNPPYLKVADYDWPSYEKSACCYSYEQALYIVELILEVQSTVKFALSKQIAIENLLIQIIRSHERVSLQSLLHKLDELQNKNNLNISNKDAYKEFSPSSTLQVEPQEPLKLSPEAPLSNETVSLTNSDAKKRNICYNTLMQFAAVELEGSLKKEGN